MTTTTKPDIVPLRPELIADAKPDLEQRVADRKRELIAELIENKKRSGLTAVEAVDAIKRRLSQLDHLVKTSVVDGWQNVSDAARAKFELWIDR